MSGSATIRKTDDAMPQLPGSDAPWKQLIDLSCDWYWAQDTEYRFTRIDRHTALVSEGDGAVAPIGKCRWDIGLEVEGGWDAHRALLAARAPFRDVVVYRSLPDGTRHYFSISGAPFFDRDLRFLGYRGTGREITEPQSHAAEVLQFRTAIDSSPDPIFIVDPEAMRFLYVNDTACRLAGVTREEYLQRLTPMDVTQLKRDELERLYADAIAKGDAGATNEFIGVSMDGRRGWFEGHRRAVRISDRWVIVTVLRDITQRKIAEKAARWRGRIHALLGVANGAMLRASAPLELYQRLCDAAVHQGKFVAAAMLLVDANGNVLTASAASGGTTSGLAGLCVSLDDATGHSADLIRKAYRTRESCVRDDLLTDEKIDAWRQFASNVGARASAAFPVIRGGEVIGVFMLGASERQAFDEECVVLLRGMTENIPLALDNLAFAAERREREEQLSRFQAAMDASPDLIFIVDPETMRFLYVNETACRLSGYTREEYVALGPVRLNGCADAAELRRTYAEVIAKGEEGLTSQYIMASKDGSRRGWFESHRRAVRVGDKLMIVTISREISQRKRAEKSAQQISRMYAALGATNEAILRAASPQDLFQRVCDAAVNGGKFVTTAIMAPDPQTMKIRVLALAGQAEEALRKAPISVDETMPEGRGLVGIAFRTLQPCVSHDYLHDPRTAMWHKAAEKDGVKCGAAVPLVRSGRALGVLLLYSAERRAFDDEIVELLQRMAQNIVFALENFEREAERKHAEDRIQYLAMHDGLTGMPNRVMFSRLLQHTIETSNRYKHQFAVLFIDLDRFKIINDSLGHEAGDSLLREVAARLKHALRASDMVARFGGDEFVALLPQVSGSSEAAAVARKTIDAILAPMTIMGQECSVTASVGIAMYPADGIDEQSLMKNADIAMYLAKNEGKNDYQFYSRDARFRSLEQLTLEANLRRALERDEFSLHYQAKRDFRTGAITGVEALLRWRNPELGLISPVDFIPLAEETGMIVPIGRWVLKTACAQNVAWQREGLPPIHLAVNLSARQFADPNLLGDIAAALDEAGMSPDLLELELTEGMVTQNADRAIKLLTEIKQMGVRLAIDDFGTGYSSLGQLKRFPIDTLKVDRSFICDIAEGSDDNAITEAIIALGKTLDLIVVAEGVETEEQAEFLRAHACDEMQGFYFSHPVSPAEFARLLRLHSDGNFAR